MELSFAAPVWAWAFSSLLLPILIHFFASRWQQPRRFAALRFLLPAAEQGRARRISDWWLLLLRMLLLAALVLFLMAPRWHGSRAPQRLLTIYHPAVVAPEPLPPDAFRLCSGATLQALSATPACTPEREQFLADLFSLLQQQPDIAQLTAFVPAELAVPMLALPALTVPVVWQISSAQPDAIASSPAAGQALALTVQAPAEFAPLFIAANQLAAEVRWQLGSDGAPPALAIAAPASDARVLWHDAELPWQNAVQDGVEYQFHIVGAQLHLRLPASQPLGQHASTFAALLSVSEQWLQRGSLIWRQPSEQIAAQLATQPVIQKQQTDAAASRSERPMRPSRDWQVWCLLLALVLLVIERGVAHGRR